MQGEKIYDSYHCFVLKVLHYYVFSQLSREIGLVILMTSKIPNIKTRLLCIARTAFIADAMSMANFIAG